MGFVDPSFRYSLEETEKIARHCSGTLNHRGPDDNGVWLDAEIGLAMGHRRLSIIDLSATGHQPMISACGRYTIVYNGEIYNYEEIQGELEKEGTIFRGHSDTEVLLEAIAAWGIEKAIQHANGMFAFALWDRKDRILYLARDRFGQKPLYYGFSNGIFYFASELRALNAHPDFGREVNRSSLALFLRHGYIPAPYSIFEGISKLVPGTFLCARFSENGIEATDPPIPYWSTETVAQNGHLNPFRASDEEVFDELERILRDAVNLCTVADVPVGAFLSGGVDSSIVVALMQSIRSDPVKTFSIGFEESVYNEAHYAKSVASQLGTDHTEFYVTKHEALSILPKIPSFFDEPFADSSQLPTYFVSDLARKSVTVCLSGDGGDELFGGYDRYIWANWLQQVHAKVPRFLRRFMVEGMLKVPVSTWDQLAAYLHSFIPSRFRYQRLGDKVHKLASVLDSSCPKESYFRLVSLWNNPQDIVYGAEEPSALLGDLSRWPSSEEFRYCLMLLDTLTYLPDDILVKVDRSSMAVSLESRIPLLDHRVFEFVSRLPFSFKIRGKDGKWLLRSLLKRFLPQKMIDRPKMGFGVPIDHWLRGELRDWAEDCLGEDRLSREAFFEPKAVREKWKEHLLGRRNWHHQIWCILMFQLWLEAQKGPGVYQVQ